MLGRGTGRRCTSILVMVASGFSHILTVTCMVAVLRGLALSHEKWLVLGLDSALPNKRLKLAAPRFKGSVMFVNNQTVRRSLSAIR